MNIRLLSTALGLIGATSAFAQDTTPPVIFVPASNVTRECDGTTSWQTPFDNWYANHGGAQAFDDTDAYLDWTDDYVPQLRARLALSPHTSVQSLASAPLATMAEKISAMDMLASDCGEVSFTVTWTATDDAGNSASTTGTFTVVDTTAPTMAWALDATSIDDAGIYTVSTRDLPVTITVTPSDLCGGTTLYKRHTYTGSTTAPTVSYGTNTFTVTAGTAGTEITFYSYATDDCGNASAEEYVIIKIDGTKGNVKAKGNQGVGNGVDPNTPGYVPSGGNDDPQYGPGNPGARYKNRF